MKLQKYTDFKEELIRLWKRTTAHMPAAPPTTGIIPNKVHEILKPV
jgi:hypothetical protein